MKFVNLVFLSYIICTNKLLFCKIVSNKENILLELSNTIKETKTTIKEFEELYKLTKDEILKFKDIIKDLPKIDSHTHDRFVQLSEPANEAKIRESLYVTQYKRYTPQSSVSIDVKENVDDIVKNSTNLTSFTDEPDDNYFEDELHRMKMEELSKVKIKSLENQINAMENEIKRLITPKDSIKTHTPFKEQIKCKDPSCFDRDPSIKTSYQYPPDRTELGNAGWLFLHTFASKYPDNPDDDTKLTAMAFLYSFANMYPCSICRDGLVDIYRKMPPKVDCRKSLVLWASKLHNLVNVDLNKPVEKFTYEELLKKYS